jgi:hypothetical protein
VLRNVVHALGALAARSRHAGMDGLRCTVRLEQNWLRELVLWVVAVLAAR